MTATPSRKHRALTVAVKATCAITAAFVMLAGAGCTDDTGTAARPADGSTDSSAPADAKKTQPVVVASTSWVAAFAKAAGIDDIQVVAPATLQHPADYDPRPSDLARIADADYVLLAGFEGFAERMTEATDSGAEVIKINADNTSENIRKQVLELAQKFGTTDAAEAWIDKFEARVDELKDEIDDARPTPAPTAIAHAFMTSWVEFAGVDLVGTFGPAPVSAEQLAGFTAASPDLIFDNAHVPAGGVFDDLDAVQVSVINFPPESLDLIDVFETNTKAIIEAFGRL